MHRAQNPALFAAPAGWVCNHRGDKYRLRPIAPEHLEQTRKWANSLLFQNLICRSSSVTEEDQRAWFERLVQDETRCCFAVENLHTGAHVGNVGLNNIAWQHRRAEYWSLLDTSVWGQGLGLAVTLRMKQYALETLKLHRLELLVCCSNARAAGCYVACGFEQEGVLRAHHWVHGQPVDMMIMAVLADT